MQLSHIAKSGWIRLRRRVADLSPEEARRGKADMADLSGRLPFLEGYAARAQPSMDRYREEHEHYCTHVGHPVHAASLELAALLDVICRTRAPKKIVDLGSGFTSYILRQYAAEADHEVEVWSVDDAPEWLGKSVDYVASKGLDTTNLVTWPDFQAAGPSGFDLVVHDMGFMETRYQTLMEVVGLAAKGGLVILDDMHKTDFREKALADLDAEGIYAHSIKPITRDGLTRYAYLVLC
jgi:predicted O-methyltransferase YrrM